MSVSKNKKSEELKNEKKKCFIITPIGDDGSEIRRQIDGVIDECIAPALKDEYEIVVAHRICKTGSINDQVIGHIYNDELVIANLTGLNANVMYELAFCHALRKPVIVIKNKDDGFRLPFDITEDRTIFYTNDISGTGELKNNIRKFVSEMDFDKESDNPITRGIRNYKAVKDLENVDDESATISNNVAKLILQRIDELTMVVNKQSNVSKYNGKTDDTFKDPCFLSKLRINNSIENLRETINKYGPEMREEEKQQIKLKKSIIEFTIKNSMLSESDKNYLLMRLEEIMNF